MTIGELISGQRNNQLQIYWKGNKMNNLGYKLNTLDANEYGKKAEDLFRQGYNCAQAVVLAFNDILGLDDGMLLSLSSSFGGGMGRLREVCGAVTGAFIVLGVLYGYSDVNTTDKGEHYKRIQEFANRFKEDNGSIICRELLGLSSGASEPTPERRTKEYYDKRPCPKKVYSSAYILAGYINEIENNACGDEK